MQMPNTHKQRCSTSLSFRRMQIRTMMRYHLTLVRTAIIKKNTSNKCWLGCGGKGTLLHCCMCTCAQSCPNLCDPVYCSPPGPSVHGIFQVRVAEWVSISFSRGSSQPRDRTQVSCIGMWILNHWATWEALLHCWWECKLAQPLWSFLKTLKLPYDSAYISKKKIPYFLSGFTIHGLVRIRFFWANLLWHCANCSPGYQEGKKVFPVLAFLIINDRRD